MHLSEGIKINFSTNDEIANRVCSRDAKCTLKGDKNLLLSSFWILLHLLEDDFHGWISQNFLTQQKHEGRSGYGTSKYRKKEIKSTGTLTVICGGKEGVFFCLLDVAFFFL